MSRLRKEAKNLQPVLRIGKKGMTESVFIEIEKLLKKRKLIKIKFLNNCPIEDKSAMADFIVQKSKTVLVSKMGNVFTIYKR